MKTEQREVIYEERRRVLNGESMRDAIFKMITDIVESKVDISINEESDASEWDYAELNSLLLPVIPLEPVSESRVKTKKKNALKQQLKEEAVKLYRAPLPLLLRRVRSADCRRQARVPFPPNRQGARGYRRG